MKVFADSVKLTSKEVKAAYQAQLVRFHRRDMLYMMRFDVHGFERGLAGCEYAKEIATQRDILLKRLGLSKQTVLDALPFVAELYGVQREDGATHLEAMSRAFTKLQELIKAGEPLSAKSEDTVVITRIIEGQERSRAIEVFELPYCYFAHMKETPKEKKARISQNDEDKGIVWSTQDLEMDEGEIDEDEYEEAYADSTGAGLLFAETFADVIAYEMRRIMTDFHLPWSEAVTMAMRMLYEEYPPHLRDCENLEGERLEEFMLWQKPVELPPK